MITAKQQVFRQRMKYAVLLLCVGGLLGGTIIIRMLATIDAGKIALATCSGIFIADRSLDQLRTLELTARDGEPDTLSGVMPRINIDRTKKLVSASYGFISQPMRAAFREGLGCSVLSPDAADEAPASLPSLSESRPSYDKNQAAWPTDGVITPANSPKPYQARLDAAIERAFSGEGYGPGTRTVAALVVHGGEVVAERYREGFGPHTQYRTWSTAKSLTNGVVGAAIQDGVLAGISAPSRIPEWSEAGDPRREITLANLLNMSSGLLATFPNEGSRTPAAYWGGVDSAAEATNQSLAGIPGTRWHYANFDTLLLLRALKAALGDNQAYLDFPYERLFDRIGMHDTFAETDAFGNYVMSSQVYTNARDLARFATLFLNDGVWRGERILPAGWAQYSCTKTDPGPTQEGVSYGAQWWIYNLEFPADAGIESLEICTTNGARGQFAAFSPEHDLVIVRRGVDAWGVDGFSQTRFFEEVIGAIAAAP